MPGKYSHGVVLADNSGQAKTYFPDDQYSDYLQSLGIPPPTGIPQTLTPVASVSRERRMSPAISSAMDTRLFDAQPSFRRTKSRSKSSDLPRRWQDPARKRRPRRLVLDWEEHNNGGPDAGPHQPNEGQPGLESGLPSPSLSNDYTEKEVYLPVQGPHVSDQRPLAPAHVSRPLANPSKPRVRRLKPRNDVESFQQFKSRGAPLSPALSNDGEPLLSVQEFLDCSPNLTQASVSQRRYPSGLSSPMSPRHDGLPQAPFLQPDWTNAGRRSSKRASVQPLRRTSAISLAQPSDDDDDFVRSTPANLVRNLTSNSASWSDDGFRRRKIMDLTTELYILSRHGGRRSRGEHDSSKAQPEQVSGGQPRRQQSYAISDVDDSELSELDGLEIRPLQKLSNLSRPQPNTRGQNAPEQDSLFQVPDDQLSPLTPYSTRSLESTARDMMPSTSQPDLSALSHPGRRPRDYFSGVPGAKMPVHNPSYDNIKQDILKSTSKPSPAVVSPLSNDTANVGSADYDMRSNSISTVSMAERTSTSLYGARTGNRRQTLDSLPSLLTPVDPAAATVPRYGSHASASAAMSMRGTATPPFGIPSIVRDPEKIAAINAETRRRSSAQSRTNTMSSSTTVGPSHQERQKYRYRLPLVRGRHASLSDLAGSWRRARKGSFSSTYGHVQSPTKVNPSPMKTKTKPTSAMGLENEQTPSVQQVQTSRSARPRSASLGTESFRPLSMNPPARSVHSGLDSKPAFDPAGESGGIWTRTEPMSRAGGERQASEGDASPYRHTKGVQGYNDGDMMTRFYRYNEEQEQEQHGHDDVVNDDDEMAEGAAALPPPDISRHRVVTNRRDDMFDQDRVESIFRVLQDGPQPLGSNRVGPGRGEEEEEEQRIQSPMHDTAIMRGRSTPRRKSFLGRILGRPYSRTQLNNTL